MICYIGFCAHEGGHMKKTKMILSVVLSAVVLCMTAILLITKVIIPNSKYKLATALYDAGRNEEAIAAFAAMDGYKDSAAYVEAAKASIVDREQPAADAQDEADYAAAISLYAAGKYSEAIAAFTALNGYKDSARQIAICETALLDEQYNAAVDLYDAGDYEEAIAAFSALNGYKDSAAKHEAAILDGKYAAAIDLCETGKYEEAITTFTALNGYKDSVRLRRECWDHMAVRDVIAGGFSHTVGLKADGTVVTAGSNGYGRRNVSDWKDIIAIAAGNDHTVGLKVDGTVVAAGRNDEGQCGMDHWKDMVAITAGGFHTVGLKADGTVAAVGSVAYGQCDVSDWKDIIAISAGTYHTVGLKADGTVVAVGNNTNGQCDVSDWTDIVAIAAGV